MEVIMKTINIDEAKLHLNELLMEVNDDSTSFLIKNDSGKNAYLVGEDYLNAILETIQINSCEDLAKAIIKEGKTPYKEAIPAESLDW